MHVVGSVIRAVIMFNAKLLFVLDLLNNIFI